MTPTLCPGLIDPRITHIENIECHKNKSLYDNYPNKFAFKQSGLSSNLFNNFHRCDLMFISCTYANKKHSYLARYVFKLSIKSFD